MMHVYHTHRHVCLTVVMLYHVNLKCEEICFLVGVVVSGWHTTCKHGNIKSSYARSSVRSLARSLVCIVLCCVLCVGVQSGVCMFASGEGAMWDREVCHVGVKQL